MATFTVHGPFQVPYEKRPAGRVFNNDVLKNFWGTSETRSLKDQVGVYVFAIKPPKSATYVPFYVGQTTNAFGREVFTDHKIIKYHNAIANYKRGAPYLFLLVHPAHKTNKKQITAIEDHLILVGYSVNPKIENDKGVPKPEWAIQGVLGTETRGASKAAVSFRQMFAIEGRDFPKLD